MFPGRLTAVPRATIREEVVKSLRAEILSGNLPPGSRLPEVALGEALHASRSTIREAILRLADEQLVVVEAHQGATVRRLSPREVRDIYDIRASLEGLAALRAAERPRRAVEGGLREGLGQMEGAHDAPFPRAVAGDLAFHEAVCRASGNEWLLSTWRRLGGPISIALLSAGPELVHSTQSPEHHRKLMRAILRGDGEAAARIAREHLARAADHVVARMEAMLEQASTS